MADIQVINGQRTIVAPAHSGLPPKLSDLLVQMATFGFSYHDDFTLGGARPACDALREHRFRRFREGRWFARDGIRRGEVLDLHLRMCADCGAVEVRDVSLDVLVDPRSGTLMVGRRGPNRRNHLLGWYSGARPNQRTYS